VTRRRRIDVHQHLVPPGWAAWLRSRGVRDAGGRELPDWSPEAALQLLEDRDIATAALSVSTPGYAPALAVGYFAAQLDAYDALDADGHGAIDRRSAAALFPRFA
jgi:hypothetical protein